MGDYLARIPLIDLYDKDAGTNMVRPGAIKTHFPFDRVPYHPQAKYIGVIRQPKDVCVSMYQTFNEALRIEDPELTFDKFFELFVEGQTRYVGYFDYLRQLWAHKDDSNVLLVSYEQMKQDLCGIIQKTARFLDIDLANKDELLDRIATYASFDYMKKNYDSGMRTYFNQQNPNSKYQMEYIRKGVVGD